MSVEMLPKKVERHLKPAPVAGARKFSLLDWLPANLVVLMASPYLAGKDAQQALAKGVVLFRENHFCGTLDLLGEDASSEEDCHSYVAQYIALIDLVATEPIKTSFDREKLSVSMKPSMFSPVAPNTPDLKSEQLDQAFERIAQVVDYASRKNVRLSLEAEDNRWTNFHLDAYFALVNAGYKNLGTVIQSRLFRTKQDLKRFDDRCRVRLVTGIYQEPAQIAHTEPAQIKNCLVEYAKELLYRGTYLEYATHDQSCIERFFKEAVLPQRIQPLNFEVQFLLGVPRLELQKSLVNGDYFKSLAGTSGSAAHHAEILARSGILVRMYLPFGKDRVAGPYCKRRLIHNPNMIVYGIRNLLGIQ
jgi:proline dehydrogenase